MMWLINFIQKRPSDKTILWGRIIFWLIYILAMYYNLIYIGKDIDSEYLFWALVLQEENKIIVKYIITFIWIVPVFMWITNICLLKAKYMRIIQIIFWIVLFYISWMIIPSPEAVLDVDFLIWLMWILPLVAWITWKCITSSCLKYKEKITKIRV